MAPRILIFTIAMGADYSFYVKTIETHARSFFKVIIFSIDSVHYDVEGVLGLGECEHRPLRWPRVLLLWFKILV